jgi:hypothetical protein
MEMQKIIVLGACAKCRHPHHFKIQINGFLLGEKVEYALLKSSDFHLGVNYLVFGTYAFVEKSIITLSVISSQELYN